MVDTYDRGRFARAIVGLPVGCFVTEKLKGLAAQIPVIAGDGSGGHIADGVTDTGHYCQVCVCRCCLSLVKQLYGRDILCDLYARVSYQDDNRRELGQN